MGPFLTHVLPLQGGCSGCHHPDRVTAGMSVNTVKGMNAHFLEGISGKFPINHPTDAQGIAVFQAVG